MTTSDEHTMSDTNLKPRVLFPSPPLSENSDSNHETHPSHQQIKPEVGHGAWAHVGTTWLGSLSTNASSSGEFSQDDSDSQCSMVSYQHKQWERPMTHIPNNPGQPRTYDFKQSNSMGGDEDSAMSDSGSMSDSSKSSGAEDDKRVSLGNRGLPGVADLARMKTQWDRRADLVGHSGFGLATSAPGGFPAPRLPGQPDFQPPYFPPPYQQPVDFHHQVDPYAHVNPFQQTSGHYNLQHDRHAAALASRGRPDDPLNAAAAMHTQHAIHAAAGYDPRSGGRGDYMPGLRRPHDALPPHPGLPGMEAELMAGLHNPLHTPDDVQNGLEDANNFLVADPTAIIRKGMRPKSESGKELVVASHIASPADVFCSVPGRLSLLSSTSKYKVTVAEVQRRLSPPECLNASLLGGVLRRAKSKNGGRSLRDKLEKIGLSLPAGRRKAANVTLLTSLVEGETLRLARDYTYLCETEFPARPMAEFTLRHADHADLHGRKNMLLAAKQMLKEMVDVLVQDRSPVNAARPQPILEPGMQRHLTHFSLLTHGFGQPAVVASLNCALGYFTESIKLLDKSYAAPPPPHQAAQQPQIKELKGDKDDQMRE